MTKGDECTCIFGYHTVSVGPPKLHSRTFIVGILRGGKLGFVLWLGVLCSSWVSTSKGSTLRMKFDPLGYENYPSVREGNLMVAR